MLVVTTEMVPGFRVDSVIGHVLGVTARGLNPFNEGVKLLEGGINPRMAASLEKWRQEAVTNMIEHATRRGANAVLGMRFDHRHISPAWVEICAYGTAVQLHPLGHPLAVDGAGAPAVAA